MRRRAFIRVGGTALTATVAGCLGTTPPDAARSPTPTGTCGDAAAPLVELLPPAPSGRDRAVDTDVSQRARDEFEAAAMVVAEYRDADDAVLNDYTVRVVRFRGDADARRVLVGALNNIEFDSGRVGVGVLVGRLGFLAAAPRRERARTLLARSPALSSRCLDRHELLPSRTRTEPSTG